VSLLMQRAMIQSSVLAIADGADDTMAGFIRVLPKDSRIEGLIRVLPKDSRIEGLNTSVWHKVALAAIPHAK
jgi:hypothetical protein